MIPIGLGDSRVESEQTGSSPVFKIYISNRPPLDEYKSIENVLPLSKGDVSYIAQSTGNHWRKIFNVYAKFIFSFQQSKEMEAFNTWQVYRDECLLQDNSGLQLLFSKPDLDNSDKNTCHIIMGKQYAIDLGLHEDDHEGMVRIDNDFVICPQQKLIVCPYFDYRQLSNIKIETLVNLVHQLF